ncbi:MAG: neutral/alkaline non-lysosomal ceramidase N-terminal domain-containing protein, partial [Myxococcales bacterium]|nr:neutral/alkaline non-lysosomal ceramidase N-terminal domain-containing protein [Myxococcales bacterium]
MALYCGVATVPLVFPDGLGLAGYGPAAGAGQNEHDPDALAAERARAVALGKLPPIGIAPLAVRVMVLQERDLEEAPAPGETQARLGAVRSCVLLGFMDLMAGSQLVSRRVVDRLNGRHGLEGAASLIGDHNVLIMPSHTHSAPGHYTGIPPLDLLLHQPTGHREDVVRIIVRALTSAFATAWAGVRPANLDVQAVNLYGIGRNRSPAPFEANPEAEGWPGDMTVPAGEPPDAELDSAQKAVDPRMWVVSARAKEGGLIGTFAVAPVHNTALGRVPKAYDGDWTGRVAKLFAEDAAQSELAWLDEAPWVAVAQGPAGDVT